MGSPILDYDTGAGPPTVLPGPIPGTHGDISNLVNGQSYLEIVFDVLQLDADWEFTELLVVNTTDPSPLNIWPGILTAKSDSGFTLQFNGMPDSNNYFLHWVFTGIGGGSAAVPVVVATTYTLSGPATGLLGVPSTNFTVSLPVGSTVTGTVTVTPHDGGAGGTFTPATVNLTTGAPSATFTYTPTSGGAKTISVTNNGGLTNPGNLTYTATAPGLSDGDPVSTWYDSSVNGNDATMTGSNRPTFKTNIVNGKPVVRFTSVGQSELNLTTPISGAFPWIVFAVMKAATGTSRLDSLDGSDGGNPHGPFIVTGGGLYVWSREGYLDGTTPVTNAFHVLQGIHSAAGGGGHFLLVDGTLDVDVFTALANTGNFTTIGYDSVTPAYCDGDIAEIIIYTSITTPDRVNIEKYLGNKYGITVAGGGTAVDPSTVANIKGWWKADSLG